MNKVQIFRNLNFKVNTVHACQLTINVLVNAVILIDILENKIIVLKSSYLKFIALFSNIYQILMEPPSFIYFLVGNLIIRLEASAISRHGSLKHRLRLSNAAVISEACRYDRHKFDLL